MVKEIKRSVTAFEVIKVEQDQVQFFSQPNWLTKRANCLQFQFSMLQIMISSVEKNVECLKHKNIRNILAAVYFPK